jgi:hypothetical protein
LWPGKRFVKSVQLAACSRHGTFRVLSLVFCTLLGPEGPGRLVLSGAGRIPTSGPTAAWSPRRADGFGLGLRSLANYRPMITHDTASTGKTKYRPYFENYTVDASILDTRA